MSNYNEVFRVTHIKGQEIEILLKGEIELDTVFKMDDQLYEVVKKETLLVPEKNTLGYYTYYTVQPITHEKPSSDD